MKAIKLSFEFCLKIKLEVTVLGSFTVLGSLNLDPRDQNVYTIIYKFLVFTWVIIFSTIRGMILFKGGELFE